MKSQIASTLALAFTLALSLLACAQEPTATRATAAPNAPAIANQIASKIDSQATPVRVVVQFKNPAAIDAHAFVQRLQTLSSSPVHYVAAVSGDTHVYRLAPQPGQSPAQMLQQFSAMPEIARAEFDQKTKAP